MIERSGSGGGASPDTSQTKIGVGWGRSAKIVFFPGARERESGEIEVEEKEREPTEGEMRTKQTASPPELSMCL